MSVVVAGVTSGQGGRESRPQGEGTQVLTIDNNGEVREMRDAATVLAVIRERGRRGLPLERVYRCLFNPDLFLLAYGKIYRNAGAMTPGLTRETVDGMRLSKIEAIIGALRQERYRWTPVRRTYINKKGSSKKRPLGLPTWSDKLLQEVDSDGLARPHSDGLNRPHGWSVADGVTASFGPTGALRLVTLCVRWQCRHIYPGLTQARLRSAAGRATWSTEPSSCGRAVAVRLA